MGKKLVAYFWMVRRLQRRMRMTPSLLGIPLKASALSFP